MLCEGESTGCTGYRGTRRKRAPRRPVPAEPVQAAGLCRVRGTRLCVLYRPTAYTGSVVHAGGVYRPVPACTGEEACTGTVVHAAYRGTGTRIGCNVILTAPQLSHLILERLRSAYVEHLTGGSTASACGQAAMIFCSWADALGTLIARTGGPRPPGSPWGEGVGQQQKN